MANCCPLPRGNIRRNQKRFFWPFAENSFIVLIGRMEANKHRQQSISPGLDEPALGVTPFGINTNLFNCDLYTIVFLILINLYNKESRL
jgi:hypothetical protein